MKNNYLLIGEDDKLINFELDKILSKINYISDNKIIYDLNINNLSDILDEAATLSLFSPVKVIIGKNFDINKVSKIESDYLDNYLNNYNKDIYIILIASKIDGRKNIYKIFKDNFNIINVNDLNNKDDLVDYISNRVADKNYHIDSSLYEYFLNKVGNDLNNINNELDKLFIYKLDDKIIKKEDIDLLVIDNIDSIIYEFTNAFIDDNSNKVISMYQDFKKENLGADYIINSLFNSLHQVLIIKILSNNHKSNLEISKVIGKKEYYVKKMLERLYRYTEEDLCNYLDRLNKIDYNLKSGNGNILDLELFLINKC